MHARTVHSSANDVGCMCVLIICVRVYVCACVCICPGYIAGCGRSPRLSITNHQPIYLVNLSAPSNRTYKAVEDLQPGDLVLVVDGAGKVAPSPVVEVFGHR